MEALDDIDEADLEDLAAREVFQVARTLHDQAPDLLPSTLIQRLATDECAARHPHRNSGRLLRQPLSAIVFEH